LDSLLKSVMTATCWRCYAYRFRTDDGLLGNYMPQTFTSGSSCL